jgi:hypothetical protein
MQSFAKPAPAVDEAAEDCLASGRKDLYNYQRYYEGLNAWKTKRYRAGSGCDSGGFSVDYDGPHADAGSPAERPGSERHDQAVLRRLP